MKHTLNIMTNVFYCCVIIMALLLSSCDNKDKDGGNVSGTDASYSESLNGQMKESYNERLAEQRFLHYCAPCHGTEGKGDE